MKVQKFRGKTEQEATEKARQAMGEEVMILLSRPVKKEGLFSKGMEIEVTAAKEEAEETSMEKPQASKPPSRDTEDVLSLSSAAREKIAPVPPTYASNNKSQENDDEASRKALEALRQRCAGKLEVKEQVEEVRPQLAKPSSYEEQVRRRVHEETLEAREMGAPPQNPDAPFMGFLQRKGFSQPLAISLQYKMSQEFPAIDLTKPSSKRTACFQFLKREIARLIPCYGPICLDRYRASFHAVYGERGAGKFMLCSRIARQYVQALGKRVEIILFGEGELTSQKPMHFVEQLAKEGIRISQASTLKELNQKLDAAAVSDLVFISVESQSIGDLSFHEVQKGIQKLLPEVTSHFVVHGSAPFHHLNQQLRGLATSSLDSLMVSHMDRAETVGILANLCHQTKLPLSYLTSSSSLDRGLKIADSQEVAKKILLEERLEAKQELSQTVQMRG